MAAGDLRPGVDFSSAGQEGAGVLVAETAQEEVAAEIEDAAHIVVFLGGLVEPDPGLLHKARRRVVEGDGDHVLLLEDDAFEVSPELLHAEGDRPGLFAAAVLALEFEEDAAPVALAGLDPGHGGAGDVADDLSLGALVEDDEDVGGGSWTS